MSAIDYPATRKTDQVDTYHGVRVPDPYRWLEDDRSAETAAWVEAENKVTFAYLEKLPYRAQLVERLKRLVNYARYTPPIHRGPYYFFGKNEGLQNQAVMYVQKGLTAEPVVLLDPNQLSADGTVRLGSFAPSSDGRYVAYGLSSGGSDWQEIHVMDVASRKPLSDKLMWIKASGLSWAGNGFFYSRYDAPAKGHELSSKNEYHKVYFHKVGDDQSRDELIYEDKANPERFHIASATRDGRFAVLYVSDQGKGKDGNALYVKDLARPNGKFTPVVSEITNDSYYLIGNLGSKLLIRTNHSAPNYRVVAFDTAAPSSPMKDVIPESSEPMSGVVKAGSKLIASRMKDVASQVSVYNLNGKFENLVELPGPGTATFGTGEEEDGDEGDEQSVFFTFTSLSYPRTIFKYDSAAKKTDVFRAPDIPGFNPASYESKQVFYNSKDGTRVPMFLVYKKGIQLNGKNPTLLYGYGGFNVANSPYFSATRLALLEQGFVYASANMRGGSEYGEKWHRGGMKLEKQNVFDDFISAAEWLIANKYTSKEKLACNGGSNGGLLVGAVINQRPDLFRAAVPQVGVMDMLRFHKFTIGWNWISDYGSSENPQEFKALYAYSPIHNIRAGVRYPATFITTADHDDRVVPAHSFKYAATMQEKASKDNPVLIRIDTKSGHGASNTTKMIEETADVYAFLFDTLGVTPKY